MPLINRRWILLPSILVFILTFSFLLYSPPPAARLVQERVIEIANKLPIPGLRNPNKALFKLQYEPRDAHPISVLIAEADKRFLQIEDSISQTFQHTAAKYRRRYGRHPPPGFAQWYKFARDRRVHNIDDFEQIMEDLRPFWYIPPVTLRVQAAHLGEQDKQVNVIMIRDGNVVKTGITNWRLEGYMDMIKNFADKLPDMDIPINAMDSPRVIVPWDDLQKGLTEERKTRIEHPETINNFTQEMGGFAKWELGQDGSATNVTTWVDASGKPFLDLVKKACAPGSHANRGEAAESSWKTPDGGLIRNYKVATDLCTVGPELQALHGFMMASSSMSVTHELVPIFGESKTSVNNDILIPAAVYWRDDKWGAYNISHDIKWEEKKDKVYWRGMTSGGISTPENWQFMHRSRLVRMLNATHMGDSEAKSLMLKSLKSGTYDMGSFQPQSFLSNYSDVAFYETAQCQPEDCGFYLENVDIVPQAKPGERFNNKILLDVDGKGFSARWKANLQSRSLAFKATIFREWHDSRLFAWRHFVPLDNRFDDLISILAYFVGIGDAKTVQVPEDPYVPRHEFEAKRLALQGRSWAGKVLRKDDIEIYMYRLLLEWGRLIDDNRDNIGYSGNGAEVDKELNIH